MIEHFIELRKLAQTDLSQAHMHQHLTAANEAIVAAGITKSGSGAYSSEKPFDTCVLSNGAISGKKFWISNLEHCDWMILTVRQSTKYTLVLVNTDQISLKEMPKIVGMEKTYTGHASFVSASVVELFDKGHPTAFDIEKKVMFGFVTNHLGAAEGMLNFIKTYVQQQKISCTFELNQLKLAVSMFKMSWEYQLDKYHSWQPGLDYIQQRNTMYGFAKQTLVQLVNFYTQINNSDVFFEDNNNHQRYKDMQIYLSHLRNLYRATSLELY